MIKAILPTLFLSLFVIGCGGGSEQSTASHDEHDGHEDHGDHAAASESGEAKPDPRDIWPALYELDDLAHRAEFLNEDKKWDELKEVLRHAMEAAEDVMQGIPEGIEATPELKFALGEIESVLKQASQIGQNTGPEMLESLALSMAAITDKIMATAELPHVHAEEAGHDHDEHEHGHNEQGHDEHSEDDHGASDTDAGHTEEEHHDNDDDHHHDEDEHSEERD